MHRGAECVLLAAFSLAIRYGSHFLTVIIFRDLVRLKLHGN